MVVTSNTAFTTGGFGCRFAWIDLINSEYRDGFDALTDHLTEDSWVEAFVRHWGWAPTSSRIPIEPFKALRATLRAAAESIAGGGSVPEKMLMSLNRTLRCDVERIIEHTHGEYRVGLRPRRRDWRWIASDIVASFGELLETGQTRRLKICPNRGCRWVFFDETKANTRRWCNDRRCGNRDKVRRLRARRAVARAR